MGAWRNRGTLLTLSHSVVGHLPEAILFYSQFGLKGMKGIQLGIGSSWGSYDTQCHLGFGVGRPLNISGRLNLMWAPSVWWGKVSHLLGMATWHSQKIQGTLILGISWIATDSLDQSHSLPDEWGRDSLGVLWPPCFTQELPWEYGPSLQPPDGTRWCQELSKDGLREVP